MKLNKSNRKKQNAIQEAIRSGVPLAGLLAATAMAATVAGCGRSNDALSGDIRLVEPQMLVDGDIVQPTQNLQSEVVPNAAIRGEISAEDTTGK